MKMRVTVDHPLMPFMVEWAAQARNYYKVGPDGRTAMERLMGHRIAKPGFEFAEKVYYLPPKIQGVEGRSRSSFRDRMYEGIFLGLSHFQALHIIGTPHGITTCRTVRPLPEQWRWDAALAASIKGTPWEPRPRCKGGGGESHPVEAGAATGEQTFGARKVERRPFKMDPWVFETFGRTPNCRACQAKQADPSRKGMRHSDACRKRIE